MQDYSQPVSDHKRPHRSIGFAYILPVGLVIGFLIFCVSVLVKGNGVSFPAVISEVPTPTAQIVAQITKIPTNVPTPTKQPEPEEAMKKEDIAIMVLNGSGTAGVAGKAANTLEAAGYSNIKTGNADAYTYKNLTIRYAQKAKAAAQGMKTDLEKTSPVETVEEAELPEGVDIEVIVGK